MNYLTVGVLGHVDHGKTALVRALTGIETDRLKEERERGISIVLGFADLELPEGRIAFVDAPGHERFVRTMVSGATGIGAALLVIDANEGVRKQTREHFEVARLLGVGKGVIAITKCDAAGAESRAQAASEARELVKGSFLDGAAIVETSAVTAEGLDALRAELGRLVAHAWPVEDEGWCYLPVDRVFSMTGFGTVVTGTLRRGALRDEDEVQIYPGGGRARVRQIESHGERSPQGLPGRRTAVNLRGVDQADLHRGSVLATPGSLTPSLLLDVSLNLLGTAPRPIRARDTVRLLFGTAEVIVRPRFLDRDALGPGQGCLAQLQADSPVPFLVRERFIVRSESPVTTIGGGVFLGASARRRPRKAQSIAALEVLSANVADEVLALRLEDVEPKPLDLHAFARAHRFTIDAARGAAGRLGLTVLDGDRVIRPEHVPPAGGKNGPIPELSPEESQIAGEIEKAFQQAGLQPPAVTEIVGRDKLRNRMYRRLIDTGVLVATHTQTKARTLANTVVFHRDAIDTAGERLRNAFGARGGFETSEAKSALGVSRKFLIPLLEHFDAQRVTRRNGDRREFVSRPDSATT